MKQPVSKIKLYILAHKVISAIVLVVILYGGYWGYKKITSTAGDIHYLTAKVEKSTIIASVSGTGQVSSLNQVDVKAKVSGDAIYIGARDGQRVGAGGLIIELDTKDAQKTVRDAEVNLESSKIALEKLKLEKSDENMDADLAKSYDDGFNTVSNVFLDLPGIMTGLNDMFFKSSAGTQQQWNVDWYEGQVASGDHDQTVILKQNFLDSYNKAKKFYDASSDNYKMVSRISDNVTIEKLIADTYTTTKLISDTIKNANNYIDFVNSSIQKSNADTPALITTHKATLNTYTSKTNTHLVSLLEATTSIKSYKDAFPSSDLDLQSGELSVRQKENALQDTKDKLADYFIRAPFGGTISKVNVKKSDSVSSGSIVATLITQTQLAEISLNEVDVAKIKIGQKSTLTFDAIPDLTITGKVAEIDTVGAVSSGVVTYIVKISFDTQDARVKSGMSVSAAIITDEKKNALTVPNSAIKSKGGKNYVEINPPTLTKVDVEVGLSNDSQTEIISGIKEGDEIVTRTILPSATTTTTPSIFGGTGGNRVNAGGTTRIPAR